MKVSTFARLGVLAAVLAVIAGPASSVAAARPEWLNKEGKKITSAHAYTSPLETAYFEAVSPNGSRAFELQCSVKTAGTVEESEGEMRKVTDQYGDTRMACTEVIAPHEQLCAPPQTVEAVNLPWATELVSAGTEVHNLIKPGKEPGWKITCTRSGNEIEEKCPFGGYSRFTTNGTLGAELLYEPAFAKGEECKSTGLFEGNTLKLSYLEVTPGYTVSS